MTDTYTYDAFGNLLDKTGATTNNYLFTGEFFDANVGFYYLRARYMDPAIGRFVTMDTFAGRNRDPYSLHKYLYAHANPVNNIDPSGNMTLTTVMVTGAIIGILSGMQIYHVTTPPDERTFVGYATWAGWGGLTGSLLATWAWQVFVLGTGVAEAATIISGGRRIAQLVTESEWGKIQSGKVKYIEGREFFTSVDRLLKAIKEVPTGGQKFYVHVIDIPNEAYAELVKVRGAITHLRLLKSTYKALGYAVDQIIGNTLIRVDNTALLASALTTFE